LGRQRLVLLVHPRCRRSPPSLSWPLSEVQCQFCGAGGFPGTCSPSTGPCAPSAGQWA